MKFKNIVVDNINLKLPLTSNILLVGKSSKGKTSFCKKLCGFVPPKTLINDNEINDLSKFEYYNSEHYFLSDSINEEIDCDYFNMFDMKQNPNDLSIYDKLKLFVMKEFESDSDVVVFDNLYDLLDYNNKINFNNLLTEYLNHKIVIVTSNNLDNYKLFDQIYLLQDDLIDITDVYNNSSLLDEEFIELPFMLNLSKKLSFYNLLDKSYDNVDEMVGVLWK